MNYFDEYAKNYNMNNPDINYKYYHSYRVMNEMDILAKKLKLIKEEIELAKLIGLFHDIGRFDEREKFKNQKIDHGEHGVKVLKELMINDKLKISLQNFNIMLTAIENHNKFKIPETLKDKELFFTKLIRDADKLDILNALSNESIKPIIYQDDSNIDENISKDFFENKSIDTYKVSTKNDMLLAIFSYIYDINFIETLELIKEKDYYNKIYQRIENKELFKPYINYLNKYLKERIDRNVR